MANEHTRWKAKTMNSIHIVIVCEGHTEETFVNGMLAPSLAVKNVFITARLVDSKGGNLKGQRVLRYLRNTLRERNDTYVTTFFDLYALPSDFPGLTAATRQTDPLVRATKIESELHQEVIATADCRPERFFPHIQPYEFEALLFSDTEKFAIAVPDWKNFAEQLNAGRQAFSTPEHINDGPKTHPSARLEQLRPRYGKVRDGMTVSKHIGLARIRAECKHFDSWLTHMENLPSLPPRT